MKTAIAFLFLFGPALAQLQPPNAYPDSSSPGAGGLGKFMFQGYPYTSGKMYSITGNQLKAFTGGGSDTLAAHFPQTGNGGLYWDSSAARAGRYLLVPGSKGGTGRLATNSGCIYYDSAAAKLGCTTAAALGLATVVVAKQLISDSLSVYTDTLNTGNCGKFTPPSLSGSLYNLNLPTWNGGTLYLEAKQAGTNPHVRLFGHANKSDTLALGYGLLDPGETITLVAQGAGYNGTVTVGADFTGSDSIFYTVAYTPMCQVNYKVAQAVLPVDSTIPKPGVPIGSSAFAALYQNFMFSGWHPQDTIWAQATGAVGDFSIVFFSDRAATTPYGVTGEVDISSGGKIVPIYRYGVSMDSGNIIGSFFAKSIGGLSTPVPTDTVPIVYQGPRQVATHDYVGANYQPLGTYYFNNGADLNIDSLMLTGSRFPVIIDNTVSGPAGTTVILPAQGTGGAPLKDGDMVTLIASAASSATNFDASGGATIYVGTTSTSSLQVPTASGSYSVTVIYSTNYSGWTVASTGQDRDPVTDFTGYNFIAGGVTLASLATGNYVVAGANATGEITPISTDTTHFNPIIRHAVGDTSGTFLDTATGFTTTVTGTSRWAKAGNVCAISVPAHTGTSNTTAMTLTTLPAPCRPASTPQVNSVYVTNNTLRTSGYVSIGTDGVMTFSYNQLSLVNAGLTATSVFTNTGTKGFDAFSFAFPTN